MTLAAPVLLLEAFARARLEERSLLVTYLDAHGSSCVREVAVLALSYRNGGWLAACQCLLEGTLRAFRLDRVEVAWPSGPAPRYPVRFDAHAFASAGLVDTPTSPALRVAIRLRHPLGAVAPAVLPGLAELEPDGAALVHLRTSRPETAVALALSLGDTAELVHPPELARVARRLRARADRAVPSEPLAPA